MSGRIVIAAGSRINGNMSAKVHPKLDRIRPQQTAQTAKGGK